MSVINQMLRELDARGAATTGLPAAPTGTVITKRRPAGLVLGLGGLGLLAAGAVIYWMLPVAPRNPDVLPVVRQDAVVVPMVAASATQTGPVIQNAPQPAPRPESAGASLEQPQALAPVREAGRASQDRALSAATKSLVPLQPAVLAVVQVEPAVVKKIIELSPEAMAQQHYDEAQALRRAGKPDAAIAKYRQALERSPGMANARTELAKLLQGSGQADAALTLLQTGFEQQANDGLAIATGRLLADLGQRDEALEWLARGQDGLRPADHALMGALLSQAGRHEEASLAYRRALVADPSQGGWLLGLGLALEAQGRLEEARMAYRNALERGQFKPEVTRFLRERGGTSAP